MLILFLMDIALGSGKINGAEYNQVKIHSVARHGAAFL